MTLTEYAQEIKALERGEYPATMQTLGWSLSDAADFLASELGRIAWQPWARAEAAQLIGRCLAVRNKAWQREYNLR